MKHFKYFKKFLSLTLSLSLVIASMPANAREQSFLAPPANIGIRKSLVQESTEEYFYSPSMGCYVPREPLKVDAPIIEAAATLGIELQWDDEGRIGRISYTNARKLFNELGFELMSPTDYWKVLQDAYNSNDEDMIRSLLSNRFAEWLDVIYFQEQDKYFMIEHPTINDDGTWDREQDKDRIKEITMPEGRYAWFRFDNLKNVFEVIDKDAGFPFKHALELERKRKGIVFKFWDIYTDLIKSRIAAIRGYVTSSGTPSLDCGMPLTVDDAMYLMVRPCRKELPAPPIAGDILSSIRHFMQTYDNSMRDKKYAEFYKEKDNLFLLLSDRLSKEDKIQLRKNQEKSFIKMREKIIDMLGFIKMYAGYKKDISTLEKVNVTSKDLFDIKRDEVDYDDFAEFVYSSRARLQEALKKTSIKPIVFVMGHKSPDTDTVISSLFEAYRNHIMNPDIVYVPVVQSEHVPDEVKLLLNNRKLTDSITLSGEPLYRRACDSGQANWILVDQNVSDVQKFVVSILDHHTPGETALRQDVAKTIEIVGSTTGMVVQRFEGIGVDITHELARLCYGATLMDTENKSELKMTLKDTLIMDTLRDAAGIFEEKKKDESSYFYQTLMSALLSTDDANHLFWRDYKEDWGFGFSVAKMKGVFDRQSGKVKKQNMLEQFVEFAQQNNEANNFPLTLVKAVDYENDNEAVFKERMYFIFGKDAQDDFKREIFNLFEIILKNEFPADSLDINKETGFPAYIEWRANGKQLSRKKVAPILQPVVEAYNKYFYSEKLQLYVSREFLKITDTAEKAARKLGIQLSDNEDGYVNYVSPLDCFQLMEEMHSDILSLKEYAIVRREAKRRHDKQMMETLQSHGFVEVLDMVILAYDPVKEMGKVIEHPRVVKKESGELEVSGEEKWVHIPRGEPGLIDWDDVDPDTGLPAKVYRYGDDISEKKGKLSRYWSPRKDNVCVFTRGSIFIYPMTCMDGKVLAHEIQPNMGVRPCRRHITSPYITATIQNGHILTRIVEEEGMHVYRDGLPVSQGSAIEDITKDIKKELQPVNGKDHALDVDLYLKNMIPEEIFKPFKSDNVGNIQIHYGPLTHVKKLNPDLLLGYKDISAVDPDGCLIGWFIKDNNEGKKDIIITHIRGVSKLKHILYALRLSGVNDTIVSVYDYQFDYEEFARRSIQEGMKGEMPEHIAVGKSIFERKLLRKIKYGTIYREIKKDMQNGGFNRLEDLLKSQISQSLTDANFKKMIPALFAVPYVSETLMHMQEILEKPLRMKDLLTYWHYSDIVEDYVRIITTINTGIIEITKFAKMLKPYLPMVRVSDKGVVTYADNGQTVDVDISDLISIADGKHITFKKHITIRNIGNTLKEYPKVYVAVKCIFNYVNMFSMKLDKPVKDYTALQVLEELQKRFNISKVEKDVFDMHILRYPRNGDLTETGILPVGRFPFGELAADFISGGVECGGKTYVHAGSCGLIAHNQAEVDMFDLKPGDLVIPEKICDKNGRILISLDVQNIIDTAKDILNISKRPFRILKRKEGILTVTEGVDSNHPSPNVLNIIITNHTSADTPLEEDIQHMKQLETNGINSVDCETASVVTRMIKKGKQLNYECMFWVADILGSREVNLAREKELRPITDETRMRKVQGLMSDVFLYLRFKEKEAEDLYKRKELYKKFKAHDNVALIFLKGGYNGGLHPAIKQKIIDRLNEKWEIIEGEEHKISFKEMVDRWETGYLHHHFMKMITENNKLEKSFIDKLVKSFKERNEEMFKEWLREAREEAKTNPELSLQLLVFEYYSDMGQQLMLTLKPGVSLDTQGVPLQQYVKKEIVGATFCYDAKPYELRAILKEEMQKNKGVLRSIIKKALHIPGEHVSKGERFISSIFNGIHCPDFGEELKCEFTTLTDKDVNIFNNSLEQRKQQNNNSTSKIGHNIKGTQSLLSSD